MNKNPNKINIFVVLVAVMLGTTFVAGRVVVRAQSNDNVNVPAGPISSTAPVTVTPEQTPVPEVDQLNEQIDAKRQHIDQLKRQTAIYERQLQEKQDQRATLNSELEDLQGSIDQTERELEINQAEIDSLQLQIQVIQHKILKHEKSISDLREQLATLLRSVYEYDQVSYLELVVQEQTFSGFFSRVESLHALSQSIEEALQQVVETKRQLDVAKEDLTAKQEDLDRTREQLEESNGLLEQQHTYKTNLLEATQLSEKKYQSLLAELRTQAASVDSEITTLIQQVNDRLAARGENGVELKPHDLSLPMNANQGISAYFHDPTYPFRAIFEHPGIDFPTAHGTPIIAAADGVVAIARKLDWVRDVKGRILWPAYNFITIVHGGNIATVYGHVSSVDVTEGQTVKRGETIGKSGATPGTAGAGRLTTGPHLHFEVRVNGIPDDPVKYLPTL